MRASVRTGAGSMSTLAAFVVGLPLGILLLWALTKGPWRHPMTERYLHHPVEMVELVMFCSALGALLAKTLSYVRERAAFGAEIVPAWDGKAVPPSQAATLASDHGEALRRWRGTFLGRRLDAILEFVKSRGSAAELDDQLRTLADNDVMSQEASYSLVRFITWAIPILGFLGTVLGITDAISAVTPDALEKEMHKVTGGLSLAFDATALGLFLTMVLMFVTFLVERLEQGILERVDATAEAELGHRFLRTAAEHEPVLEILEASSERILRTTEQLVERQVALWSQNLEVVVRIGRESAAQQQQQLLSSLEGALENTLERHGQRLAELENQVLERQQRLLASVAQLADVLTQTSRQHQQGLAEANRQLAEQTQALVRLQEGGGELTRLQEGLAQNLASLAGAGAFEEAVQSLTAAIHLLTSRVTPPTNPPRRVA